MRLCTSTSTFTWRTPLSLRIPTPAGGTHESGLRDGLFQAVKSFVELHNLQPKGVKLLAEDVFARVSFVLSAKVLDPQFQGQIKERLNSRDAVKLVSSFSRPALELWLNQHVEYGKKLAELVIRQAQARTRAGQKVEKRKSSGVAVLPGKLTDCESTDVSRNELFLVEGDSAGGSAKMGRDKEFQAILPLRGKVLNTWETERDRLFANNEVHDIAVAIGVDPHSPDSLDQKVDLSNLRYGKICILSDAERVKLTGNKMDQKVYRHHSGYPGGLKEVSIRSLMQRRPEEVHPRSGAWDVAEKQAPRASRQEAACLCRK